MTENIKMAAQDAGVSQPPLRLDDLERPLVPRRRHPHRDLRQCGWRQNRLKGAATGRRATSGGILPPLAWALSEHALAFLRARGIPVAMVETGGDPGHAPARATDESTRFRNLPLARYFRMV